MIVVDACVLATALADDVGGVQARSQLVDPEIFAPELIDLEVTSYVRQAVRTHRLGSQRALQALADLALMPIERISHTSFLSRIWDLRDNLTPYDASYVALAETLDAPLVTGDSRLARAPGIRCEVVVLS